MEIRLTVNDEQKIWQAAPGENLRDLLRREGYLSVKYGCDSGTCGVCTVLFDGRAAHSCTILAAQADGHKVTTVEGLDDQGRLDALQEAFMETGAVQCGYCTPGMLLAAKSLLAENQTPDDDEIKDALNTVLCRCTGYVKQEKAVKLFITRTKGA